MHTYGFKGEARAHRLTGDSYTPLVRLSTRPLTQQYCGTVYKPGPRDFEETAVYVFIADDVICVASKYHHNYAGCAIREFETVKTACEEVVPGRRQPRQRRYVS